MDIRHYLDIKKDNFALNLGEDFYYYQNGNNNTLIHIPTQKEFHDIHNIRNDQPLSLHLNKLINHIPTINVDQYILDIKKTTELNPPYPYLLPLHIKYNNKLCYWEIINISFYPGRLKITLIGRFIRKPNVDTIHTHPIVNANLHTSHHFNYIYQNKLYVRDDPNTK